MKKIAAALACLLFLALSAGGALGESKPLLYEVRDGAGHTLYLLGTIHLGDEDMLPFSDAVWAAYEKADVLAVEMDLVAYEGSLAQHLFYIGRLLFGPDDSAENHLSPETYALGVEKLGWPESVLRQMRPAAWYSMAQRYAYDAVGLDSDLGADYLLLTRAHEDGKPIDELEGLQAQLTTMLSLPEDVLDQQIRSLLTYPRVSGMSTKLQYAAWRKGNLSYMLLQLKTQLSNSDYALYNYVLLGRRNARFEEQAVAYLQSGKTAFIAIGAFHIIGDDGLTGRLARLGLEVVEIGR